MNSSYTWLHCTSHIFSCDEMFFVFARIKPSCCRAHTHSAAPSVQSALPSFRSYFSVNCCSNPPVVTFSITEFTKTPMTFRHEGWSVSLKLFCSVFLNEAFGVSFSSPSHVLHSRRQANPIPHSERHEASTTQTPLTFQVVCRLRSCRFMWLLK